MFTLFWCVFFEMPSFEKSKYRILRFEKSPLKNKKYRVYLVKRASPRSSQSSQTKKSRTSSSSPASPSSLRHFDFGQLGYQHYKDSTPLKLYSNLDHSDTVRRKKFRQRFKHSYDSKLYTPLWFSWKYLWWIKKIQISFWYFDKFVSSYSIFFCVLKKQPLLISAF